jgi:hypothetical protein
MGHARHYCNMFPNFTQAILNYYYFIMTYIIIINMKSFPRGVARNMNATWADRMRGDYNQKDTPVSERTVVSLGMDWERMRGNNPAPTLRLPVGMPE